MFAEFQLSLAEMPVASRFYTLAKDITAMQVQQQDDSGMRLSPVSRLPRGAQIQACGSGFDERTIKVIYEGQYYFVFVDELEPLRKPALAATAC